MCNSAGDAPPKRGGKKKEGKKKGEGGYLRKSRKVSSFRKCRKHARGASAWEEEEQSQLKKGCRKAELSYC